jgi:cysteine desulfurase
MKCIYLDYAATTPLLPEVFEAMKPYYFEYYGNPSSLHDFGFKAKRGIENSRKIIADLLGTDNDNIIFTGGGTESNNLAIQGIVFNARQHPVHIITTSIEHSSVFKTCQFLEGQGHEVDFLPVNQDGMVDPVSVESAIKENTVLISIHYANNEIGTIQPVQQIGEIAEKHNIIFHTDAVQAFGKLPIQVGKEKISLLSSSAHKIYGPKGVGFLFMNRLDILQKMKRRNDLFPESPTSILRPLMFGGEQETGLRPSTEDVPGIIGLGKAAEIAGMVMEQERVRLQHLRDSSLERILQEVPGTKLNGSAHNRLYNNINICFEGLNGYELLLILDSLGIACSTGSACSSQSEIPSRVLTAIGLTGQEARSSLRLTLGRQTKLEDMDYVIEQLPQAIKTLKDL